MNQNELNKVIVEASLEAQRTPGDPGPLEIAYEGSLAYELELKGCLVQCRQLLPIVYKNKTLGGPLRLGLRINRIVIIQPKAIVPYHRILEAQILTYLRMTGLKVRLLIHFGEKLIKNAIHRVVNGLKDTKFRNNLPSPLNPLLLCVK
jgi:GxxExxY protein